MRGDFCVYSGDLNKLVGVGEFGVPDNSSEVSLGGRLLRELLATGNWTLVNGLGKEVVQGGPFTREDPATGVMSCLDLWVVSIELLPYVSSLVIDREKNMTHYRAVKEKQHYKLVYTDHLSSLLTLKDLPLRRQKKEEKKTIWNLAKSDSWTEYKKETDAFSEELEKIVENKNTSVQETMHKFDRIHDKIKFKVFGKVSLNNNKNTKEKENTKNEDKVKAKEVHEKQVKTVQNELEKIRETKNGKAGQIWKVREKVIGGKKKSMLPSAIFDPKTKKLLVNKDEIKEVTLKYCMDTLTSNTPEASFENSIKEKKERVKKMLALKDGCFETSIETFENNLKKFRRSGKKKL